MKENKKILLALLPFWSPMIPPIGIAALKAHLVSRGFEVKCVDATMEERFKRLYDRYFDALRAIVPEEKRGNFYSIGHDVLRNQVTAHPEHAQSDQYRQLVRVLVENTFYVQPEPGFERVFIDIVGEFYRELETYWRGLLEQEKPDVLGLSVYSDTLPASMFAFRLTRQWFPEIKTYMGGGVFADQLALNSANLGRFMDMTRDYIDKILVGEGEILFEKLLKGELPDDRRLYTLADLDREVLPLDRAEILDLSDFDVDAYPYNVSYTSRSCPFQCSFCSETIQWGGYRKKKPERIVEEVRTLYKRHGCKLFLLGDSLLNPLMKDLPEAFLAEDEVIYWGGWLRVDRATRDTKNTFQWRRGGFYHARLGIESGSQHVLDLMDKRIQVDDARQSLAALARAGIKTTTLWVIGHPGETGADFQQTLDFLEEMQHDIYEAECRPFYYYALGQAGSEGGDGGFFGQYREIPVYPPETEPLLPFQTLMLDCEPKRETTYDRVNRFVAHCKNLGIPNPYSLQDIHEADLRWKQLQDRAVPPLLEFKNKGDGPTECRNIKDLVEVKNPGTTTSNSSTTSTDLDEFEF